MRLWCRLARDATGIVDIGANVGVYALAAASLRRDIPIYAFEPNPHAYARLRVNKMKNGFGNISEGYFAIGHKDKMVDFTWVARPNGHISSGGAVTLSEGRDDVERTYAHMVVFDKILGARDLGARGLIKIDVEGAEMSAFAGMQQSVAAHKPDIILETFKQDRCDFINNIVNPLGYSTFVIHEDGPLVETDGLTPAARGSENLNQLLTTRPEMFRTPLAQ